MFDGFAPKTFRNNPKKRTQWAINQLLLARDSYGIKPLFYTYHDNNFWFSSEIKTLLPVLSE